MKKPIEELVLMLLPVVFIVCIFFIMFLTVGASISKDSDKEIVYSINKVYPPMEDAEVTVVEVTSKKKSDYISVPRYNTALKVTLIEQQYVGSHLEYTSTVEYEDGYREKVKTKKVEQKIGDIEKRSRNPLVNITYYYEGNKENKKEYTLSYEDYIEKETFYKENEGKVVTKKEFLNGERTR